MCGLLREKYSAKRNRELLHPQIMFASTEIVNPKPRFSFPSSLPLLNSHQDLLLDHHSLFLPADNSNSVQVIHETLILGDRDMGGGVSKLCALTSSSSSPPARSSSKKDRHSKIRTSQGLRDRRVRLSIGIAREFFDLQDMLGFDTASKTLDWLLSNSKRSIGELAKAKHGSSASAAFNCHVAPGDPELEEVNIPETSITKSQKLGFSKETRAKARARARERAREKICSDSPAGKKNQSSAAAMSSSTSTSARSQSQVKSSQRSSPSQTNNDCYFPNLAQDWDITYNSVVHPSNNMNLSATAGLLFTENMYQPTVT